MSVDASNLGPLAMSLMEEAEEGYPDAEVNAVGVIIELRVPGEDDESDPTTTVEWRWAGPDGTERSLSTRHALGIATVLVEGLKTGYLITDDED